MKHLFLLTLLALVGCQSAAPVVPLPQPAKRIPEPVPVVTAPTAPVPTTLPYEQKIRQQAQFIEALLSQNDALTTRLATPVAPPPESKPVPVPAPGAAPAVANPVATESAPESPLMPNAEGVSDLVAVSLAAKPGDTVNPFAVRVVPPESVREITVLVSGIVAGPKLCAVLNGRLVQAGDSVESLDVERVETDAILVRHSGRLLRLPVSEKPVRLRLPL